MTFGQPVFEPIEGTSLTYVDNTESDVFLNSRDGHYYVLLSGGIALTDIGPMRAARRRDLLGLGIRDRRFGWPLEMVLRAAAAGWRVGEIEVSYRRRQGRSKVTGTVRGTLRAARDMSKAMR